MFVGVPRVWEKFKDKIEATLRETSGIKEIIMEKARVRSRDLSCACHVTVSACRVWDVRPASTDRAAGRWPGDSGWPTSEWV